ncbi:hypothetical protein T484DRAFT_1876240 [Baffinella frigidus]|nr:hypothetical protein T484DRAFT_1876240 [Cryptophyta sp. CCMP2293]
MRRAPARSTVCVAMLAIFHTPLARGLVPSVALTAGLTVGLVHPTAGWNARARRVRAWPARAHRSRVACEGARLQSQGAAGGVAGAAADPALRALREERILEFDTERYPFREAVKRVLDLDPTQEMGGVHEISKYHTDKSGNKVNSLQVMWNADRDRSGRTLTVKPDRDPQEARAAYEAFDQIYQDFIRDVIAPSIGGGKVLFQRAPTLRVMAPEEGGGVVSVMSKLHKDEDYHHQHSELNFWLPLTPVWGGNTLWVESAPALGDFHPLELDYGRYVRFYGNQCRHKTNSNDTGKSRVSIDFRAVSDASGGHDPSFRKGVRRGAKALFQDIFDEGGFYSAVEVPLAAPDA